MPKSDWRDRILGQLTPDVARLTLVADPDGLLLDEDILAAIHDRGFELIPFEDPITFRYVYESRFRSRWDLGKQKEMVVVSCRDGGLASLPFDLVQGGRRLSFNLGDIFPGLSYPVLTCLARRDLESLYKAWSRRAPNMLGENATKEFILRHVFEIVPERIGKPSDLLRLLLRHHYQGQRIPALLMEHVIQLLRGREDLDDWPLETILPDREAFFAFLQERWPIFLDSAAKQKGRRVSDIADRYGLEFPGPSDLPFDHDDIRIYVDNLFQEGFLQAVPHENAGSLSGTWLSFGIRIDHREDLTRRVDGLFKSLADGVPNRDARHEDWLHLARRRAELAVLTLESETPLPAPTRRKMSTLQVRIDDALVSWLKKRYAGLFNLPPTPPVMLHHVPRFLSRHVTDAKEQRAALIVVDGLSLDQWIILRRELVRQHSGFRFREDAVFAWIPTLTPVSRQAVFAGKPPVYFPESIRTTSKEAALWTQFWLDQGLAPQEVGYAKGLGDVIPDSVKESIAQTRTRVIGLVVDKVDRIMHGMQLGSAGMHNQVRQWAGQRFLANLLYRLLRNGFRVHLTSDHGNVEATGCGRVGEGALADQRGSRARIYKSSTLRGRVKEEFPDAVEWPPIGLPEDYLPLLAAGRSAFVRQNQRIVSHGGASLEELVVPLIQIEMRET